MLFQSDRAFRIWDYNVSHKQLLLRSPQSAGDANNIDIIIWSVEHIDLPTSLNGLEITSPSSKEVDRVRQVVGSLGDSSQIYSFKSKGHEFFVVGSGLKVLQNDLDIFDSSLEYFAGTDSARDLGLVLAHS